VFATCSRDKLAKHFYQSGIGKSADHFAVLYQVARSGMLGLGSHAKGCLDVVRWIPKLGIAICAVLIRLARLQTVVLTLFHDASFTELVRFRYQVAP